jgi:CheY-like chemotaxis protein
MKLKTGKGNILIMDDEQVVREVLEELLVHFGYDVDAVDEGKKALEKYLAAKENGEAYDVVILDLTVPGGMGGKDVVRELLAIDPQVKTIAISGYSDEPIVADFKKFGFSATAIKPFVIEELSETLAKLTS